MVQTTYTQGTPCGVAGGLYDLSPHMIVTRMNSELGSAMKFGMGVIQGGAPGTSVKIPAASATAEEFEGVVVHQYANEMDMRGGLSLPPNASLSVMQFGKIWARMKPEIMPTYGDSIYLITSGGDAGRFTNEAGGDTIAIKGRFLGGKGTGDVAPIELFNQANVTAVGPTN